MPLNSTIIHSDSLISYAISPSTGELVLKDSVPVGGSIPRQFAMNGAGNLVAVGLQIDAAVVVLERDVRTGVISRPMMNATIGG